MKYIPWYEKAKTFLGIREIPGPKSNSKIMQWAKYLGGWIKNFYKNDDIPWCGLFIAECFRETVTDRLPANPLGALNWAAFGKPLDKGVLGALLVFKRPGGGHVGFYAGESKTAYLVLGGNQSNKVCYSWVSKSRLVAIRWPKHYPDHDKKVIYDKSGKVSTNEQ